MADQVRGDPRLAVMAGPHPSALIDTNQFLAASGSPPTSRPIIMVGNSLPSSTAQPPDARSPAAFLSLTAATRRPIIAPAPAVPALVQQISNSSPRGAQSSTPEKGDPARRGNGGGGGGGSGRKRGGGGRAREKGIGRTLAQVLSIVPEPCYPAIAGEWVKLFEGYHVDNNVEETVLTFGLSNGKQWKKRIWPRKSYPKKLHRCNTAEEILSYLISLDKHPNWILDHVPSRPPSGSIFFFDRTKTRNHRVDGYDWKTRRNNEKTIREDRMKLKVNGFQLLYGCYIHSASNPNFHRRSYWLLQNPDIIMVHYLDVDPNPSSQLKDRQVEEVDPVSYSAPLSYEMLVISDWNLTAALSTVSSLEGVRLLLQQFVRRLNQCLQESGSLLEAIEKGNKGMTFDPFGETRSKKQRSTPTPNGRHRVPIRLNDETKRKLSKVLSVSAARSSEQMVRQQEISRLLSKTPQIILCFPQNGSLSFVLPNGDLRSRIAAAVAPSGKLHVDGNHRAGTGKEGSVSQLQKHMANSERPSETVSEGISNSTRASGKQQAALAKLQAAPSKSTALQKPTEGDHVRKATPSTAVTVPPNKRGDYDPDQFSKFASFLTSMGPPENLTNRPGVGRGREETMRQRGKRNRRPRPLQDEVQSMDSDLAFSRGIPMDSVYGNQTGDHPLDFPSSPQSDGGGSDISLPLSPTSLEQLLADCPSPTSTAWNVLDEDGNQYNQSMETDPLSPTSRLLDSFTSTDLDSSSVMMSAATSFQRPAGNPLTHSHSEMGGAFPNVQMTDLTGGTALHFVPPSLHTPPSSSQTAASSYNAGQDGNSSGFIWGQGLQKGSTARSIREWLEAASTRETQQMPHQSFNSGPSRQPFIIPLDMLCPEDVEQLLQQCNRQRAQRNMPATDIASLLSGSGAGGSDQQPGVLVVSTSDIDSLLPDGELERLMNLAQNSTAEDVVTFTSDSLPSLSSTLEFVQSAEEQQQERRPVDPVPLCSNESGPILTTTSEAGCPPMLDLDPDAPSPAQHVLRDATLPEWGTSDGIESSSPPNYPTLHSPLSVASTHFATAPDFSDSLLFSPAPPSVSLLHMPPGTSSSAPPPPSLLQEDNIGTSFPNLASPPFLPNGTPLSPMQSLEDICSTAFDASLQDISEDIQMELGQQHAPTLQLEGQELNLAEQAAYRIPSSLPSSPSVASVSSQSTLSLQDLPFDAGDSPSVVELCELLSESPSVQQEDFSRTVLTGMEQQEVFHAAQVIQGAFRKYTQSVQQTKARQKHAANVIESYYKRYRELKQQREQAAKRIQQQYRMYKRRVHELNRAATFIQQMYRFHRIRRLDPLPRHRPRRNSSAGPRPNH